MLVLSFLATFVPFACGPSIQEEVFRFPDTPAAERIVAFLEAHNAGDEAAFRIFEEQRSARSRCQVPFEIVLPQLLAIRSQVGSLAPHAVLESEPQRIALLVRFGAGDQCGRLEVVCSPEPPHLVDSFTIVPTEPPGFELRDFEEWDDLSDLASEARQAGGFPALAVAFANSKGTLERAVSGVRELGSDVQVELDDRFHIGSLAKPVTSTAIARLVEQGVLGWGTTLAELRGAYQDESIPAVYDDVTLQQLLRHRAGIVAHTSFDDAGMQHIHELPGSPSEQRAAWVRELLRVPPISRPGSSMTYSNAGYTIAAALAEIAAVRGWEEVVEELVFRPAKLESAGFGWPVTEARPGEPSGHWGDEPHSPSEYYLGPCFAAAGDVHMSIGDLARFGAVHLRGLRGEDGLVSATTVRELHEAPEADGMRYASGWIVQAPPDGPVVHWHNGSTGTFYALLAVYPLDDLVVAVAMNTAKPVSESVAWKVVDAVHLRHARAPPDER